MIVIKFCMSDFPPSCLRLSPELGRAVARQSAASHIQFSTNHRDKVVDRLADHLEAVVSVRSKSTIGPYLARSCSIEHGKRELRGKCNRLHVTIIEIRPFPKRLASVRERRFGACFSEPRTGNRLRESPCLLPLWQDSHSRFKWCGHTYHSV